RVDTGSLDERQARWIAIARERDPVDVPWLMAHLIVPRGALQRARLDVLKQLPRDPRIARALVALCETKPLTAPGHRPGATKRLARLEAMHDRTLAPRLAELGAVRPVTDFDSYLARRLRSIAAKLEAEPAPTEPEPGMLAAIEARLEVAARVAVTRTADD